MADILKTSVLELENLDLDELSDWCDAAIEYNLLQDKLTKEANKKE